MDVGTRESEMVYTTGTRWHEETAVVIDIVEGPGVDILGTEEGIGRGCSVQRFTSHASE